MMQKKQLDKRVGRLVLQFACMFLFIATTVLYAGATSWKFIAVGDTRGSSDSVPINTIILPEIANEIVSHGAKFVIVPGDLVNSGSSPNFQSWKNLMRPVYNAGIGVYPVLGNHDDDDVAGFTSVFGTDIPDNGPPGEIDRTYAIEHDNVLVLALDNYVYGNVGRVNQAWVDATLSANTRPHVFAFGHMPAFKANHTDCLDDHPTERDVFWNSLKNAGATVYFCGHDHFYDHMRVGGGKPNNDVHQMIVGGGGAPLYTTYKYDGVNTSWTLTNVYHKNQYGYTLVDVNGNTITMTYYHRTGPNTYEPTTDVWTYTVSTLPPLAPGNLLATTAGPDSIDLSWQDNSYNETSFDIQSSTDIAPWSTIATVGYNVTSYTDTGLLPGTTYHYRIRANNSAGSSDWSNEASGMTDPLPPNVDALANGDVSIRGSVSGDDTATHAHGGAVQIIAEQSSGGPKSSRKQSYEHAWTFDVLGGAGGVAVSVDAWVSGSEGANFYYSLDGGATRSLMFTVSNKSPGSARTFTLPAGTSGPVRIEVQDATQSNGEVVDSVYVDHLVITSYTGPGSPPNAPSGMTVIGTTWNSVSLQFTDNAENEFGFEIWRKASDPGGICNTGAVIGSMASSAGTGLVSYTDSTVEPSSTYWYWATAFNGAGNSDSCSNAAKAVTPSAPTAMLTVSAYKVKGVQHADLAWTGLGGDRVDIWRDGAVTAQTSNDRTYTDNIGSKGSGSYVYRVCESGSTSACTPEQTAVF